MTLRERAEALLSTDTAIARELLAMAHRNVTPAPAARAGVSTASIRAFVEGEPGWNARARSSAEADGRFHVEAVVLAHGRPSMLVQRNRIQLPESPELRRRIEATRVRYESRLASVGRVELSGHPRLQQAGTAWIVAENLVVTNAHVAAEFVAREESHLVFRRTFGDAAMSACVDLREEYVDAARRKSSRSAWTRCCTSPTSPTRRHPISRCCGCRRGRACGCRRRSPSSTCRSTRAATSPWSASRPRTRSGRAASPRRGACSAASTASSASRRARSGRCRTAPGRSAHDATTLGGSSGSVVIDLETGGAIGVHFAGALERANYAVRGSYVLDAIAAATPMVVVPAMPASAAAGVEPRPMMPEATGYETRDGYRADFLGADQPEAPLPEVVRADDVLEVTWHGQCGQGDAVSTLLGRDEHPAAACAT